MVLLAYFTTCLSNPPVEPVRAAKLLKASGRPLSSRVVELVEH